MLRLQLGVLPHEHLLRQRRLPHCPTSLSNFFSVGHKHRRSGNCAAQRKTSRPCSLVVACAAAGCTSSETFIAPLDSTHTHTWKLHGLTPAHFAVAKVGDKISGGALNLRPSASNGS